MKRPTVDVTDTRKLLKSGTYRFVSLNDCKSADDFTSGVLERLRRAGDRPPDEKHMTLGEMRSLFCDGRFNLYPEYQRGVVCSREWAKDLASVLMYTSAPLMPITLFQDPDTGVLEVLDGAQRLSAIMVFMLGGFGIPPLGEESRENRWFADASAAGGWDSLFDNFSSSGSIGRLLDPAEADPLLRAFLAEAQGLHELQPRGFKRFDAEEIGRFIGRKQAVIIMPEGWSRELCILYVVYTSLKTWRQTKDEYLVHMHDMASRSLKPMEGRLVRGMRGGLDINNPTRQAYGAVVKAFAALAGFPHVPRQDDEKLYPDMIMEMTRRYWTSEPDPDLMACVERGISWVETNAKNVQTGGRAVLEQDHVVVLLYAAARRPGLGLRKAEMLLRFLRSTRPRRTALLADGGFQDPEQVSEEFGRMTRGRVNVRELCEFCFDRLLA